MSKTSQLSAKLDELRHCGEILIDISDTLREMFSGGEETPETQETPAEKPKGKTKATGIVPAKETEKPAEPEKQLTLADKQPIIDHSEVYSGVYGRASINFYAFNSNGNKGMACGLNFLQKMRDDEPLGGKSRAEDDFADDDEDFLD